MQRAQQLRAEVSEIAHESFDAALVVKTLGREAEETERFAARADELRDGLIAVGRVRGLFDPLMEALPNLGTLAVLLDRRRPGRRRQHRRRRPGLHRLPVHPARAADPRDRLGAGRPAPRAGRLRPGHAGARRHRRDAVRPGAPRPPAAGGAAVGAARASSSPSTARASADAARRHLRRPGRPHRRRRRPDRLGQVHAGRPAGPAGRPGRRRRAARRRRPAPAARGRGQRPGRVRRPGHLPLRRHRPRQRHPRRRRSTTTRSGPRCRVAAADDFVAALPDGPGHPGRRARRHALRRPAAAARAGPRGRPPAPAAGAGRRHQRRRPGRGGADPRRAARPASARPPWSSSPTGRPRSRWPTRWSGSSTAGCSPAAATTELLAEVPGYAALVRAYQQAEVGACRAEPGGRAWPPTSGRRGGALATLRRGLRMMPEFRRGLPVDLRARAGRHRRPGGRADRRAADHRPRPVRPGGPDLGAGPRAGRGLRRGRAGHRRRRLPDERAAVPDDGDRAGRAAGAGLPARARPVDAAPAGRAPRLAGLPGHQRRRPAVGVHAVGRRARRWSASASSSSPPSSWPSTPGSSRCWCWSASSRSAVAVRLFARTARRRLRRGPRAGRRRAGRGRASPSSAPRRCAPTASATGRRPASTPPSTGTTGPRCDAQKVDRGGLRQRRVRRRARQRRRRRGRRAARRSAGDISAGTLIAFLFLVTLFVAPVQTASEVLNEAQNAIAGFRRVLDVLDIEPDVRDPARRPARRPRAAARPAGRPLRARRPSATRRARRPALDDVDLAVAPRRRVAIVGRDRLGQDDVRQAGHPADGPHRGPGAARARRAPARTWCR